MKKLLKPQKNVLQLVVERNSKSTTNNDTGQAFSHEESGDSSYSDSKRSSVALSSSSTPTYKRRGYTVPETLTQRSSSESHQYLSTLVHVLLPCSGPERESKASGYPIPQMQASARDHEPSTQPVTERASYSSSRYTHIACLSGHALTWLSLLQGFLLPRSCRN